MTATQHMRFWLVALVVTGMALWLLSDVLFPFVTGMAIAYLLDPVADRLEAVRAPRWLATTVVLLGFLLIIVLVILIVAPLIQTQVAGLIAALPSYADAVEEALTPLLESVRANISESEFRELRSSAGQYVGNALSWIGAVLGEIWRGGMAILDLVSLMVITPVVAFYLLRDWDRLTAKVDEMVPRPYRETIRKLATEVDTTLAKFIRGQGTVCLILGIFYAVGLTAAGLNFGLLVGFGAGLISFIPYVGSIAGFIAAMGIALFQFDSVTMWLVVAGIFVVGQAIEGNFLTPKLVGESVGLHPVWVMFALLAGASLFGFTGVMLAVPVAAVIGVLVRFFIGQYQVSHYFLGAATPPSKRTPATRRRKTPARNPEEGGSAAD
ncbi:MAG: AI-2E family transporter [Inquilinus sp.]|nr:AI-2E family transporter [Inquilinus sp.]